MNLSYERRTEGKQRERIKRSLRKAERTRLDERALLEAPRENRTASTALLLSLRVILYKLEKDTPSLGGGMPP